MKLNKRATIALSSTVTAVIVGGASLFGIQARTSESLGSISTSISPGASFDAAYKAAPCDSIIIVNGGTYGSQKLTRDSTKANCRVTFRAAAGETPFINGDFLLGDTSGADGPDHITIDGIDGNDGIGTRCFVEDVVIQNVKWPVPVISGSRNVTIRNSEFGPAVNRVFNITAGSCSWPDGQPYGDVVIENNWFHDSVVTDYVNPPPNGYHSECIQQDLGAIRNLTIRGNVLQNCQDFGVLFNGQVSGLLVENNFIDNPFQRIQGQESATLKSATPRGGTSIRVAGSTSRDIVIRNNSALGQLIVDPGNVNVTVTGNISNNASGTFALQQSPGLFIDSNANNGGGYGSRADWNLHLASGSAALDRGNPQNYSPTDIDGETPNGTPEAGADYVGGGPPPPTTTEPPPTTTQPPPTDSLPLTIIAQTTSTVTIGWTPVAGLGYRFLRDGVIVSNTWDQNRSTAKFSRKAGAVFRVEALKLGVFGTISP